MLTVEVRPASISLMSSIAGSAAEGDNTYSLHGACVGMYSNELEGVAFTSSRNFTRGQSLERGPCTAMRN